MTPPDTQGSRTTCTAPTDRAIAFAIAVVRSKPDDVSIQQYITHLRQHAVNGRRKNAVSFTYRYLDCSSFWRSEYERVNDARLVAEGEVVDLRRELDSLKAKRDEPQIAKPTKKRKQDQDIIPYLRQPKKAKHVSHPGELIAFEFEPAGTLVNVLLRSMYQMHAVLRARGDASASDVAYHVVQATQALPPIVEQSARDIMSCENPEEELERNLRAGHRAVASILVGFNKLSQMEKHEEVLGKVIHGIASMYRALLSCFVNLSRAEARNAMTAASNVKASKKARSAVKVIASKPTNWNISPILDRFAKFLAGIVDLLDAKIEANKAIFESLTYHFFEKLGHFIFTMTFGHSRQPTLEAEILHSHVRDDVGEETGIATEPSSLSHEDLERGHARLIAPYLIHLLNRVMVNAPAHLGYANNSKMGKPRQGNRRSMKGSLTMVARDRLQRTLVNSIFGKEGMEDIDPLLDCLKLIPEDLGRISVPKAKVATVDEWFQGEVWRLLGWEILSKEGD